jgi:hypothetical protein
MDNEFGCLYSDYKYVEKMIEILNRDDDEATYKLVTVGLRYGIEVHHNTDDWVMRL